MRTVNQRWVAPASLLLVFPTVYFISISVLKFNLGVDGPFDNSWPLLLRLGIKESIGVNINLLILFGPLLAILMNVFQVLTADKRFTKDHFHFHVRIRKRWFPIVVAAFCGLVMAVLILYLFAENCLIGYMK